MKIRRGHVHLLYETTKEYSLLSEKELCAKRKERRALHQQATHAFNKCWKISCELFEASAHYMQLLFLDLIRLGCSLKTVLKILEVMGYDTEPAERDMGKSA